MCENILIVCVCLQESYTMLTKYQINAAREEIERVDTLRFQYEKMQSIAVRVLYIKYR